MPWALRIANVRTKYGKRPAGAVRPHSQGGCALLGTCSWRTLTGCYWHLASATRANAHIATNTWLATASIQIFLVFLLKKFIKYKFNKKMRISITKKFTKTYFTKIKNKTSWFPLLHNIIIWLSFKLFKSIKSYI